MLDTVILAIAIALAAVGVGGLIVDGVRAARADGGRRFSADLGWTLLLGGGPERALRGLLGITTLIAHMRRAAHSSRIRPANDRDASRTMGAIEHRIRTSEG